MIEILTFCCYITIHIPVKAKIMFQPVFLRQNLKASFLNSRYLYAIGLQQSVVITDTVVQGYELNG